MSEPLDDVEGDSVLFDSYGRLPMETGVYARYRALPESVRMLLTLLCARIVYRSHLWCWQITSVGVRTFVGAVIDAEDEPTWFHMLGMLARGEYDLLPSAALSNYRHNYYRGYLNAIVGDSHDPPTDRGSHVK